MGDDGLVLGYLRNKASLRGPQRRSRTHPSTAGWALQKFGLPRGVRCSRIYLDRPIFAATRGFTDAKQVPYAGVGSDVGTSIHKLYRAALASFSSHRWDGDGSSHRWDGDGSISTLTEKVSAAYHYLT